MQGHSDHGESFKNSLAHTPAARNITKVGNFVNGRRSSGTYDETDVVSGQVLWQREWWRESSGMWWCKRSSNKQTTLSVHYIEVAVKRSRTNVATRQLTLPNVCETTMRRQARTDLLCVYLVKIHINHFSKLRQEIKGFRVTQKPFVYLGKHPKSALTTKAWMVFATW